MNLRQGFLAIFDRLAADLAAEAGDFGEYFRAHFLAHLFEQRVTAAFLPAARRLDDFRLLFRDRDFDRDCDRDLLFRERRALRLALRDLDLLRRERFWDFDFAI